MAEVDNLGAPGTEARVDLLLRRTSSVCLRTSKPFF